MTDLGPVGVWSFALRNGDRGQIADAAAELEELGYSAIWYPGGARVDFAEHALTLLGATKRVIVASGIASIWTHPAATIASERAAIDRAHPGRFLLGLGVSHATAVGRAGLHYERPLRKMVSYLDELDAGPLPVPKDHRILAALGPRMLALARDRSIGSHPYFVTPEHTRRARGILGRDAVLAPEQMAVLETDPAKARDIARRSIALYLDAPNYRNNLLTLGFSLDDFSNGGSDRLVDEIVAWGDTDSILRRIREHRDAGANHVCVQILTGNRQTLPMAQWRQLAAALPDSTRP